MKYNNQKIFTISEFVAFLNLGLKSNKVAITGEVAEVKTGPTGHVYFTLKDQKDGSMLGCIIWASKYRLFGITLEQGVKIVAFGNPEIYAGNGRLSFICETIQLAGEGDLKKQYDLLKEKLTKEGLFDIAEKRIIPNYPQKIGVITSKQGAVIHDFLNNLGNFGFKIKMIDSRVEGQGAVEDLLLSIKTFRKQDIDVLVIIRGGGSMESLMPFNNELLVREVAGFPVPVVVGIGHDKDVPLVCLAADKSESTPTAVANLLSKSWHEAVLVLERHERRIFNSFGMIFEKFKTAENRVKITLGYFENYFKNIRIKINNLLSGCLINFKNLLLLENQRIINLEKIVNSGNPENQLKLGYSIATISGKIIKNIKDVSVGSRMQIKLVDGSIDSEIKSINN